MNIFQMGEECFDKNCFVRKNIEKNSEIQTFGRLTGSKLGSFSYSLIAICRCHKIGLYPGTINDISLGYYIYTVYSNLRFRLPLQRFCQILLPFLQLHRHSTHRNFRWIDPTIIYFGPIHEGAIFARR